MRTVPRSLTTLALLVFLAACSTTSGHGTTQPTPTSATTGTSAGRHTGRWTDPQQPAPTTLVNVFPAPSPIPALSAPPKAQVSLPWHFVGLSPDGLSLTVLYVSGAKSCIDVRGAQVQDSATEVTVTVWGSSANAPACADSLVTGSTVLSLASPLGSRDLVHSPVDPTFSADFFRS